MKPSHQTEHIYFLFLKFMQKDDFESFLSHFTSNFHVLRVDFDMISMDLHRSPPY